MDGTAPATASSGSTTTGPTSFSDTSLTWSGDSSSSTPASSTPAASASAETTSPSADPSAPDGSTPAAGEPPKDRWDAILANARQKAAEEAMAPYAWAKAIPQQEFQQIAQMARRVSTDPIGHLQELIAELQSHPQHSAALRSLTGRALAQLKQQQGAPAAPQAPDLNPIPLALEDGRTFSAYSAEQVKALVEQAVGQVKQDFQPVTKTIETLQAERAAAERAHQIDHFVTTTYQDVATWPGMDSKESQAAVAQALAQMRMDPNDPREVQIALNTAYRQVVLPTLGQKAEAKLLDSLKTKATAATSVNPSSAASSSPRGVTSFYDKSLSWK